MIDCSGLVHESAEYDSLFLPLKPGLPANERLQSRSTGFMDDLKEVEEIIGHRLERTQHQEHEIEA
jgi:hypothetical protein